MFGGDCRHRYATLASSQSALCSVGIVPMSCPDCNRTFLRIEWRLFLKRAAPFIAALIWLVIAVILVGNQ